MFRSVAITLEMIKFQHTIFALPFAFLAAFTAARGVPSVEKTLWITLAMFGARSAAMAFNRLVDVDVDAANPRTKMRALPAGLVSRQFVILFTITSIVLFVYAAYRLNRLAFLLSPIALIVVLGYSFTKRFTWASHLVLGLALAIAPVGAGIAIEGRFNVAIFPLAIAVIFWTAGFDILYSLQDVDFDRSTGLYSLPSRVGAPRALALARVFHAITILAFITFGVMSGFGLIYWIGVAASIALVVWQHSLVTPTDISRIDAAFFTANGILSIGLFVCGAADILTR